MAFIEIAFFLMSNVTFIYLNYKGYNVTYFQFHVDNSLCFNKRSHTHLH